MSQGVDIDISDEDLALELCRQMVTANHMSAAEQAGDIGQGFKTEDGERGFPVPYAQHMAQEAAESMLLLDGFINGQAVD